MNMIGFCDQLTSAIREGLEKNGMRNFEISIPQELDKDGNVIGVRFQIDSKDFIDQDLFAQIVEEAMNSLGQKKMEDWERN